ncbi:MAG: hypothetical protein U1F25_13170 [Rubrivivax sp.]
MQGDPGHGEDQPPRLRRDVRPDVGDRIRLADTELLIEIEKDYTLAAGGYGEEVKFGGGKTIRDGMGQASSLTVRVRAMRWMS